MPTNRVNPDSTAVNPEKIFVIVTVMLLFLLALINFDSYLHPQKVLGVETVKAEDNNEFWPGFLKKNPDYIPGLIETGNLDRVKQIDPNYQIQ